MQSKEQWINDTLDSINNIARAKASPYLAEQILQRLLSAGHAKFISIRPVIVWRVAASIILLIGLNVFTALHFNKASNISESQTQIFSQDYFSYINAGLITE